MARNKGTFNFAANFQVKMQEALDPRVVVSAKADLINKETWPYDGDTIYLYEGLIVGVAAEKSAYMLVDAAKITETDYSGWQRIDGGAAKQVEVIDGLESDSAAAALSARQGKVLMNEINTVAGKLTGVYTYKGSVTDYSSLPADDLTAGDVYNVEADHDGHPAGTNWAWTGTAWDPLAGNIDLSAYYTSEQVDAAILVETQRATAKETELLKMIEANTAAAAAAQGKADTNETSIGSLTKNLGDINTLLNGEGENEQDGLVGRLTQVEEKNTAQDGRLTTLEKLVSGGETEGGQTLLEVVNENKTKIETNTKDIETLKQQMGAKSVSEQIGEALAWVDVE